MPSRIKLVLSLIVLAVAVAVYSFQARAGQGLNSWLALGLAVLMIAAMWLFPEAKGYGKKPEDRR